MRKVKHQIKILQHYMYKHNTKGGGGQLCVETVQIRKQELSRDKYIFSTCIYQHLGATSLCYTVEMTAYEVQTKT